VSRRDQALPFALLLLASALIVLAWWWPNRPVAGDVTMPAGKFNSVSFTGFRTGQSPLAKRFPTSAQVDQDLALIATSSRGIRSYASIEGDFDLPALARKHGLKMWEGIWLGSNRADNAREMAAGIAAANKYPDVIERVVVGNEVLLRKDLPVGELIGDIDAVKRAIKQPVTYADVWNFFLDNPQVVSHLDVVTIHILPYWEDVPTNIDGTMAHLRHVVAVVRARFPGKTIAIGETGWPSRGRWRRDAAPSLVNEAVYFRRFITLAQAEGLDYNFFQSFDEYWKYRNEGVVGASWGLWTADRRPKFPLHGPVQENADWPAPAVLSILCGLLLYFQARPGASMERGSGGAAPSGVRGSAPTLLALTAMSLGAALGFAWAGTAPVLFDRFALVAGIGNLAGQVVLALLFMRHLARPLVHVARSGRDATEAARSLLRGRWPAGWRGPGWGEAVFDDLAFVFVWTACVLQLLLWYDPRYRDFPLATFAVPLVVTGVRWACRDIPSGGGAREEWVAGCVLVVAAVGSAVQEGWLNRQSLVWNGCALVLASPVLWRAMGAARRRRAATSAGARGLP
jgi:exo-beta-1,3-glucanase (GH17 family)